MKYVEIITSLPIDRTFQYMVTGKEQYAPEVGKRVRISFGYTKRIGYIVKMEDAPQVENPKPLIDIIDEEPIFTSEMIDLARWIKDNYFCSWGEALEAMIPGPLKHGKVAMTTRIKEEADEVVPTEPHNPNKEQQTVLDTINKCIDEHRTKFFFCMGSRVAGRPKYIFRPWKVCWLKVRPELYWFRKYHLRLRQLKDLLHGSGIKSRFFILRCCKARSFLNGNVSRKVKHV